MMLTWAAVGYGVHLCQAVPRTRVIIQTQKEEKGNELIKGAGSPGYAGTLYEQQDCRLQREFPLSKPMDEQAAGLISWENESEIQAVPRGADQIRSYHPSVVIFDEAAHLDEFQQAWAAAEPVCRQMLAPSSVAQGYFWNRVKAAFGR